MEGAVFHVSSTERLDTPLEIGQAFKQCSTFNLLSPLNILLWRHNGRGGISNHQPHDCLLNRLFRRRSKKTSKLRVTGLCAGNSPGIGEFPAQMASNAENVSIWWRHHEHESSGGSFYVNSIELYKVHISSRLLLKIYMLLRAKFPTSGQEFHLKFYESAIEISMTIPQTCGWLIQRVYGNFALAPWKLHGISMELPY